MENKPLVTIYTQGYNAEKYIAECIESVLAQTYDNFEYFVVNHGSKDSTLDIINEYAKKDKRIKVYDIPNSERGFMTDIMIRDGHGEYVMTVDSDDYLHPECVEKLVNYGVENNLDMVFCPTWQFRDGEDNFEERLNLECNVSFDISYSDKLFPYIYDFLRTTWGKIVRLDVIKKADFSTFKANDKEIVISDTAYALACYEKCERIGGITDRLLYYRIVGTSVTAKFKSASVDNNKNVLYQSLNLLNNIGDTS
ncbi:MAG: glycosyltransferase, partial [Eubacterium sp.]|nr:glycosyltransferase [Eubacterium sp.]